MIDDDFYDVLPNMFEEQITVDDKNMSIIDTKMYNTDKVINKRDKYKRR